MGDRRETMNARQSIIYTETISRENAARETWMAKYGKEYGLGKKLVKKEEAPTKRRRDPPSKKNKKKEEEDEEPEETRPLSLVYNQERYPAHYDLSRWNDLAVFSGYKSFTFRVLQSLLPTCHLGHQREGPNHNSSRADT